MRRRWALICVLGLGSLPTAGADAVSPPLIALSLPLPEELPVTASFGEFRGGHMHAGIDFSTRRELGWSVRAAADGEVYRVKVEARGYGRAVYVRPP